MKERRDRLTRTVELARLRHTKAERALAKSRESAFASPKIEAEAIVARQRLNAAEHSLVRHLEKIGVKPGGLR